MPEMGLILTVTCGKHESFGAFSQFMGPENKHSHLSITPISREWNAIWSGPPWSAPRALWCRNTKSPPIVSSSVTGFLGTLLPRWAAPAMGPWVPEGRVLIIRKILLTGALSHFLRLHVREHPNRTGYLAKKICWRLEMNQEHLCLSSSCRIFRQNVPSEAICLSSVLGHLYLGHVSASSFLLYSSWAVATVGSKQSKQE